MIFDHEELDKSAVKRLSQRKMTQNGKMAPKILPFPVVGDSFFKLSTVKIPIFAVGISILSIIFPKIKIFLVLPVPHCHFWLLVIVTISWRHLSSSPWSKMPDFLSDFRYCLSYFRFWCHVAVFSCRLLCSRLSILSSNS